MKTLSTMALLAALLLPVTAQSPQARPMRDAVMRKFDQDKDGKLNAAETEALKAARKARIAEKSKTPGADRLLENPGPRVLEKYDTDKNGKLSDAEKQAAREDFRKRADANKDGKVDGAERAAAGNAVKAAIAAKQGKTGKKPGKAREAIRSRILERFDENKDGQLNETERARMRAAIQSRKTNV